MTNTAPKPAVEITSFGYLHAPAPEYVDLTFDLRRHFRDPHVSSEMRHMTANDEPVRRAVYDTPGILLLVDGAVTAADAFASGPSAGTIRIAVGCAGGRHRAPAFTRLLAAQLGHEGFSVSVRHRDLDKAVVQR